MDAQEGKRGAFEDTRYNRQELMPQIGVRGQQKLGESSVVVIGAGGVKSPLLYYLAAMGVGRLRVIDFDRVELSNLNRQILFTTADIGASKAVAASERLAALNPEIAIEAIAEKVSPENIDRLLAGYDVVVEGGDSPEGRRLVNDHCIRNGVPMVHPSAQYNYGYVLTVLPGRTACLECVFPDLPPGRGGSVPVVGIAAGLAGVLGAGETLKLLLGHGQPYVDGFLTFSGFQGDFQFVAVPRRPDCASCGEHRYQRLAAGVR
jgi:molybdopterin/thiamine biosynthesis adenylyltransferase